MKKLTVSLTHNERIWGWCYLAVQLLVLPTALQLIDLLLGDPLSDAQLNFVFFCINFICITVIFHRFLAQCGRISLAQPWLCLRYTGQGLLLYWLGSFLLGLLIARCFPDFSNANDQSIAAMTQENYALMSFGTVLLVPVVEETLYRGVVFGTLYERSPVAAYIVSAAAFAALHVVSYIGSYDPVYLLVSFVQYIPAGLCLAWAYVKADSIWAPVLMHITINQLGVLSMR